MELYDELTSSLFQIEHNKTKYQLRSLGGVGRVDDTDFIRFRDLMDLEGLNSGR